jgi:hypothetical protein
VLKGGKSDANLQSIENNQSFCLRFQSSNENPTVSFVLGAHVCPPRTCAPGSILAARVARSWVLYSVVWLSICESSLICQRVYSYYTGFVFVARGADRDTDILSSRCEYEVKVVWEGRGEDYIDD